MEGTETAAEKLLKSGKKRAVTKSNTGPCRAAMEDNDVFLALIDQDFDPSVIELAFAKDYPALYAQHSSDTVINAIGSIKKIRKKMGLIPSETTKASPSPRKRTDKPAGTKVKTVEIAPVTPEPEVKVEAPVVSGQEPFAVVEEPVVEVVQEPEAVEVDDTPIPGFETPVRGFETPAPKPISPAAYVLPKTKKTTL